MPKYFWQSFILITFLFACTQPDSTESAGSQSVEPFTSDSAQSTVSVSREGDDWLIESSQSEYRFIPEAKPGTEQPILLRINKKESLKNNEVQSSTYTLSGFLWNGESFDEKAWELNQEAVEMEVLNGMLLFKQAGHQYDEQVGNVTFFLYSLATGKQIVDYTYDRLSINIMTEPQGLRMLTYTARLTAGNSYNRFELDSTLVGLVRYSNENGILDEIEIRLTSMDYYGLIPPYTPSIELVSNLKEAQLLNYNKNLLIWPLSEEVTAEEIGPFGIKITYYVGQTYRPVEIIIPVDNDAIDVNGIIFDDSLFELSLIKS